MTKPTLRHRVAVRHVSFLPFPSLPPFLLNSWLVNKPRGASAARTSAVTAFPFPALGFLAAALPSVKLPGDGHVKKEKMWGLH